MLTEFKSNRFWGNTHIEWNNIFSDVNVVVGINGSGKTTMMQLLFAYCKKCFPDQNVLLIESVDNITIRDKRSKDNALLQELEEYVFKGKSTMTLMKYRMQILDNPDRAVEITTRINGFFSTINGLFERTKKAFSFEDGSMICTKSDGEKIGLEQLSSGEKHILLILLRVFLLGEKPAIVLMDEPENTMHISWQRQLIDVLVSLNPNAQYILTTHSPSLFGAGWGDRVVYMENLIRVES